MPSTRRSFLEQSVLAAFAPRLHAQGLSLSPYSLERWVDPLPIPPGASPERRKGRIPHYRIPMREFQAKIHRDLAPTTFWGYAGISPGPRFETRSGEPLTVEWINELPVRHLLPVDHSLHGAESDKPGVRTVVHLHGGKVPPENDGNPERWIVPGQSALCHYPNAQDAAMLFYHDHAMGITRLNAVAGLFGFFFVRDAVEDALDLPKGRFEIPIAIYDRLFQTNGQLAYPVSRDPASPWVSEYNGNAILLNGKLFPYLEVDPAPYRLRILNSSNAGFFTLSLANEGHSLIPGREPFFVIGSDQGLLAEPVEMKSLPLSPGERADLIADFRPHAARELYLKHGPIPVMQIRVSPNVTRPDWRIPSKLRPVRRTPESEATATRQLTLDHHLDPNGKATLMLLNGAHYSMPVTEKPLLDSTEIWTLINLTDDTHPIHLHLVRFQILDRRRFDHERYHRERKLVFTGPPIPPEPWESGWKDTVRADVLMATRIIVRFEGFAGRYVWHCHVLEHEDNEMMRPYEVIAR